MNHIGKNIKRIREKKKITQEQLAEKMNVTRQAVSNWETEKTEPDVDTLQSIAHHFGVPIEELIYSGKNIKDSWSFLKNGNICSLRSAGVLIKNGKLLVQREKDGNEYAIPGGLVKAGETSEEAVIRRYREETGEDIFCDRMLWIEESFWEWNKQKAHTITFYYFISCKSLIPKTEFTPQKCNGNVLYGWIPIEKVENLKIYPAFIKGKINNISNGIEHFIYRE